MRACVRRGLWLTRSDICSRVQLRRGALRQYAASQQRQSLFASLAYASLSERVQACVYSLLTVVALSYAVLYLATLDRISDLRPVLVPGGRGEALRGRFAAVDCDTDRPQGQCVVTHESRIGR